MVCSWSRSFARLHHAGICITVDDLVALLLNHAPGVFDDRPSYRGCCRTDLPVEEPESGVPAHAVVGIHDNFQHVLLHIVKDVLR